MSRQALGKVVPSYVGVYDAERGYVATDIVTYETGLYMCVKPVLAIAPDNTAHWSLLLDSAKLGGGAVPDLAKVATTGSYDDLLDKPDIPTLPTLALVATSGSYNDLVDKPDISALPDLADVAISGSYDDLVDKPTLAPVSTTGDYDDLSNKPDIPTLPALALVATSGSYGDLSNKPDLSGYVPTTRKINGQALGEDVALSATDVGAVPISRTINGKALSADITLAAADVAALPLAGGTMTGTLTTANTAVGTFAARNIQITTTDLTAGTSSLATGRIVMVYE